MQVVKSKLLTRKQRPSIDTAEGLLTLLDDLTILGTHVESLECTSLNTSVVEDLQLGGRSSAVSQSYARHLPPD